MNCCCECTKKKHRDGDALQNRLSRIEGQIRGIKRQLDEDAYCVDILTQVSAAQNALGAFSRELLDSHIRTCVAEGIKNGDGAVVDELMDTLKKFIK